MIKPPSLICGALFLGLLGWQAAREKISIAPLLAWSAGGALLPIVAAVAALAHWHAFGDFLWVARVLVPYYAGLQQKPVAELLRTAVPARFFLPLLLAFFLARPWRRTETAFLAAGLATGVILYVSQRKGWPYHLYVESLFLFVLLCFALALALRSSKAAVHVLSAVTVVFVAGAVVLPTARRGAQSWYPTGSLEMLERDLSRMGGAALNGSVQCLDMADGGCINALYRSGIVQSTGFIYDYYLFPETPATATERLQPEFLTAMQQRRPRIIIQSADIFPGSTIGYGQVARWPAFAEWLASHYNLAKEQPTSGKDVGYRIYELKGSQ
jgi:hypothetical protein